MPTVWTIGGFRVVVYPNDHRPEHVHVIGTDCEAIFNLQCPDGPVRLRERYGCSRADLRRIQAELNDHAAALCAEWESIHGSV
jgi:Domain of unknown function (DUF4160)